MKFGEWSDYCLPLVKSRMKANTYHNNSDYLQKARKYGHFTGYKN